MAHWHTYGQFHVVLNYVYSRQRDQRLQPTLLTFNLLLLMHCFRLCFTLKASHNFVTFVLTRRSVTAVSYYVRQVFRFVLMDIRKVGARCEDRLLEYYHILGRYSKYSERQKSINILSKIYQLKSKQKKNRYHNNIKCEISNNCTVIQMIPKSIIVN